MVVAGSIISAFGLSGATGLNLSLPLLTVSLLSRLGVIHLHHPFDVLSSDFVFWALVVIAILEFAADKVPAVDSVLHVIGFPLAGISRAVLFGMQSGAFDASSQPGLPLILALVIGAATATGVQATRTVVRPAANVVLLGPLVSTAEDVVSAMLAFAALLAPGAVVLLLIAAGVAAVMVFRRISTRRPAQPAAVISSSPLL